MLSITSYLLIEWQELGTQVGVEDATQASDEETTGELFPPSLGLEWVLGHASSCERFDSQGVRVFALEGSYPIDGQTEGQDKHESGTTEAPGHLWGVASGVSQRSQLNERPRDEESVGESNFHAS